MSDILHWSERTWPEIDALDRQKTVVLLPIGAVEAHGPHLPLSTDRIISVAMCEAAVPELAKHGLGAVILPPLDYTAAAFARAFAGTLSLRPETVSNVLVDIAAGLAAQGFRHLALANSHLDPDHLGSLYAAIGKIGEIGELGDLRVIFPDITRKPWALRLSDEFKSGACHAGRYEGSVVMAARPELVRTEIQAELPANPHSLSTAIQAGQHSFEEAGGPRAYFGDPASATAEEGWSTIAILGQLLAEAVVESGVEVS